jgi:hypothetical protein
MQAFVVPALRNLREERGTRFVGTVTGIKGRATSQFIPPSRPPVSRFAISRNFGPYRPPF